MIQYDNQVAELYANVLKREEELAEAKQCLEFVKGRQRQEHLMELQRQGSRGGLVVNQHATEVQNLGFPSARADILMAESCPTIIQGNFDASVQEKERFVVPRSSSTTQTQTTSDKGPAQVNLLG